MVDSKLGFVRSCYTLSNRVLLPIALDSKVRASSQCETRRCILTSRVESRLAVSIDYDEILADRQRRVANGLLGCSNDQSTDRFPSVKRVLHAAANFSVSSNIAWPTKVCTASQRCTRKLETSHRRQLRLYSYKVLLVLMQRSQQHILVSKRSHPITPCNTFREQSGEFLACSHPAYASATPLPPLGISC